jgi:thiamine-monophosphate kinase
MRGKRIRLLADQGELDLLREIRLRAGKGERGGAVRVGIGDDCALLRVRDGEELAVTTDLSIAGRHFRMDWHPPESVGHRTLARGLSDLAAMGARPVAAFLSLGVPRDLTVRKGRRGSWVERFFEGLFRLARQHKTPLAGGDLAESPRALADIVLVGAVPAGKALLRSVARPGDLLYVTGSLGGAAAGLSRLAESVGKRRRVLADPATAPAALSRHLYPQPRVQQGLALRRRGLATAAIDLSDGLSTDLAHLCEESGVGAIVDSCRLPVADGASLAQALHGGEDYELLFAAPPATRIPRAIAGVPITRIGEVIRLKTARASAMIANGSILKPLEPRGWEHFSNF